MPPAFVLFVIGLLSVGADLLSALAITVLLSPLLAFFFIGPALLLAVLISCIELLLSFFKKVRKKPAEPLPWEERMD